MQTHDRGHTLHSFQWGCGVFQVRLCPLAFDQYDYIPLVTHNWTGLAILCYLVFSFSIILNISPLKTTAVPEYSGYANC